MVKVLFSTLLFVLSIQLSYAQHTGSWGDQGNGTYKNPILESNYPDNDVIRQGDTYYMMSSTNHFTPGMVILKSKDLVNWEFSNYIMKAPITYDNKFDFGKFPNLESRGTWAGSFGFNGENYFAYWCYNKSAATPMNSYKILFSKAKTMEGPWTDPQEITWANGLSIDCTDPGVLWDFDTKKAWISVEIKKVNKIFEMSWSGDKVLQNADQGIIVTTEFSGEASKLYKFDDTYYLMNAHVRKHNYVLQRMQACNRSKNIEGPWESKLVLENGNGIDRSPSQGSLIKLDNGSWWYIHQLAWGSPKIRYMGRPQFLEPVVWKDGWPLIGVDTDGDGIGECVTEFKKPISGFPITAPATDDNFDKPELGMQWFWRYNPKPDRWSLTERPGFLRLKSCVSLPTNRPESIKMLPNVIGQRVMGRNKNVATAKFDLSGMVNGQEAGLQVSAGQTNVIGVKKDSTGNMYVFFKNDSVARLPINVIKGIKLKQTDLWLQTKIENGLATFFYSLNGKQFIQLGAEIQLYFSGFTANEIGFYSMNSEEKGFVDIDWFTYDYDGPKGKSLLKK